MPWHKEYQVYFISSKGRSSAQAGGMKEKRNVLIYSVGPDLPLAVGYGGAQQQGPPSRRLGAWKTPPSQA